MHGGFVDRRFWGPSLALLAQHFTVYAMDRRGHGDSDAYPADHDIAREYEDVAAVAKAVGAPVDVLGHSSGAHVALHAARHMAQVRRLLLYEPPRLDAFTSSVRARLHASLAAGDLDSIVATVLVDVVVSTTNPGILPNARPQVLAGLRESPVWAGALRNARAIPAEADSYATYRFAPSNFAISVPRRCSCWAVPAVRSCKDGCRISRPPCRPAESCCWKARGMGRCMRRRSCLCAQCGRPSSVPRTRSDPIYSLLTAVQVLPDRFRLVGRGGLEPPTSALSRRERRSGEFAKANDVAGRYQQ